MVLKLTFTSGNTATSIQINNAAVKYLNGTAFSKTLNGGESITVRYDGSKYIYDEIELATITNAGTVKLGAAKVAGLVTTPSAQTVTGRYYPVQTDNNNRLVVNVPWQNDTNTHYTAEVVTGNSTATTSNANNLANPYIRVLDKDGSGAVQNSSGVQLKGDGLVSISSANNVITVSASHPTGNHIPTGGSRNQILRFKASGEAQWSNETAYATLRTTSTTSDNLQSKSYLVYGPGSANANTTNYLRGDGTWGPASATVPKLQDASSSLTLDISSTSSYSATGHIKVSSPEQIKMIKVSAYKSTSPQNPGTVAFFGGTTLNSQFDINVSNLSISKYNQGGNSDWIVQVEAIGGSTYVAPLYYQFSLQGNSWNVFAL